MQNNTCLIIYPKAQSNTKDQIRGDYQSLFNLQRDLGKISAARKGRISKLFSPETNLKGEAGLRSRNSLLDAILENLQSLGHHDISNLLRQGQNDFRKIQETCKI